MDNSIRCRKAEFNLLDDHPQIILNFTILDLDKGGPLVCDVWTSNYYFFMLVAVDEVDFNDTIDE